MPVRALIALALLAGAAPAPAATLERVELESTAPPVVRLRLDLPVRVRSEEIPPRDGQPARIVLDLPGTRLGAGVRGVTGAGRLRRVRVGQFDATTARVVLDLDAPTAFDVSDDGTDVRIRLDADVVQSPPPDPAPVRARPKSGAAPYLDYDDDELQPLPSLPDDWRH
jgi:N-acetylmuramoyl-L-alanine amidase